MSCSCRKYAAWLSRSAKIATSTLAPVTSSRPDDCTWMTARWITRWNPAVGLESSAPSVIRFSNSDSRYAVRLRRSLSRSTLHARMTAEASWSSISASSRCSSVAYSWCRSLAKANARWRDCSRLRENVGIRFPSSLYWTPPAGSFLLHHALQRMLVLAGEVHHLRHLGLGHLVREDAALADAVVMHMQHDACGGFVVFAEEALEDVHDEFHRRVVVVEDQHPIHVRALGLRLGLGDDRGAGPAGAAAAAGVAIAALAVVVGHPRLARPGHDNRRSK